jgi:hypothetical protein
MQHGDEPVTKLEEAYAQARAEGKGPSAAYRACTDTRRMTAATVAANAKRFERKATVKARIEELRQGGKESGKREFSRNIAHAGAREGRESPSPPEPNAAQPTPDAAASAEEPPQPPRPLGRPTVYTEDLATVILARLAAGEPLRTICRADGMPDESTVRGWALEETHPFAVRYARAREMGFFSMADEILEIADDARNDFMDRVTRSGEVERVLDEEAIARSRMRIAARQWLLAKALPQTFGDRLEQNLRVEDITPRPQRPSDADWAETARKFRQAVAAHEARAEAEEAAALPPPADEARTKTNGSGGVH